MAPPPRCGGALTTCWRAVLAVHRKNWLPFVLGPELALESTPAPVCLRVKFSSSNFSP